MSCLAGFFKMTTPCVSLSDRAYICVTDDEYGTLMWHIYKFCGLAAAVSGKSGDLIILCLCQERRTYKFVAMGRAILKITEVLACVSLDLVSDIKG
jgi:hypothetical protein